MKPNWDQFAVSLNNSKTQWDTNEARLPEVLSAPAGQIPKQAITQSFAELNGVMDAITKREDIDPLVAVIHQATLQGQINTLPQAVANVLSNQHPSHVQGLIQALWTIKSILVWMIPPGMNTAFEKIIKKSSLTERIAGIEGVMNSVYKSGGELTKIAAKATNDDSVIKSYLEKIKAASQEVETFKTTTQASAAAAAKDRQGITDALGELTTGLNKFKELQAGIDNLRTKAEETLEGASKVGLALSFSNRRKSLFHAQVFWFGMFALGIVGLIFVAVFVVSHLASSGLPKTIPEYLELIWRMALEGPAIWFTWFAAVHYGRISKLIEDYGYKEAVALSFVGYRNEVSNDPEMLKKLQESAIKSFGSNPISVLEKADPATPVHDLLYRILGKVDADKFVELLLATLGRVK